jgi:Domain of unknown function (DUF5666)
MKGIRQTALIAAIIAIVGFAFAQADGAAAKQKGKKTVYVEGKIERVPGKDNIVIRTTDDKDMTIHVSPKTAYVFAGKTVEFSTLKPGQVVFVEYDQDEDRIIASRIGDLTLVEGEVVRVVDKDQVVLRTPDKKEVIVYVTPETRYQLTTSGGAFTDLRPGTTISVYYNVNDRRNHAHRIFLPRKK